MDWERRLPKLLAEGWSYERIGTMLGRDPETIAGRARRLGLVSAHVARTTPKGPLDAGTLAALLAEGLSIRVIAERTDRSAATVRHWMRHHALEPVGRPGAPRKTAVDEGGAVVAACPTHGETTFVRRSDGGLRCRACRSAAVSRRGRKVKQILVEEAGGRCAHCGYDRCAAALQFHHLDRAAKRFLLSRGGAPLALATLRVEAQKCVLLCANCHAEAEHGITKLADVFDPA